MRKIRKMSKRRRDELVALRDIRLHTKRAKAVMEATKDHQLLPLLSDKLTQQDVHRLSMRLHDAAGYDVPSTLCGLHGIISLGTGYILLAGPHSTAHRITDDPRLVSCSECQQIQAYVVGKYRGEVKAFLAKLDAPPERPTETGKNYIGYIDKRKKPSASVPVEGKPKASTEDSKDDA